MMLTTVVFTLVIGIEQGVLIGVVLSIIMIVYRTAIPHIAVLGKLPNSIHYRNISRFPDAIQEEDVLIIRFDAQLFFGNAEYLKDTIKAVTLDKTEKLNVLILDATSINDVDSTGMHAFEEMLDYLKGYSPVHNVKKGVKYPATLITTGDHDDRVVPAHSFKFAAELQDKQVGKSPVLIRIETNAGHGAGTPIAKTIE